MKRIHGFALFAVVCLAAGGVALATLSPRAGEGIVPAHHHSQVVKQAPAGRPARTRCASTTPSSRLACISIG